MHKQTKTGNSNKNSCKQNITWITGDIKMLESEIIAHCAPTLAGIKTANMFSYNAKKPQDLNREIREINQKLNHKGVFVEILRTSDKRALIYVYRRKNLEADLKREGAENLLRTCGYECSEAVNCENCIRHLQSRFTGYDCFPHEVGLFLGYPLDDVKGFIEQKGKNYKCCGIWKVYGDPQQTQDIFRKLKKCSEIYRRLFEDGRRNILQLTVAA